MAGVLSISGVLNGHIVPMSSLSGSISSAGVLTGSAQMTRVLTDHNLLTNRDFPDQHPISAITSLTEELSNKVESDDVMSNVDIDNVLRRFV